MVIRMKIDNWNQVLFFIKILIIMKGRRMDVNSKIPMEFSQIAPHLPPSGR
jgi:hypothetical protein